MRPYIPALAWGLLILLLTLMPAKAVPDTGFMGRYHLDKVVHALLFGVLLLLVVRPNENIKAKSGAWLTQLRWSAFLVISYGALTEVLQELLPYGRNGDLLDLLADSLGVSLATAYLIRASAHNT